MCSLYEANSGNVKAEGLSIYLFAYFIFVTTNDLKN